MKVGDIIEWESIPMGIPKHRPAKRRGTVIDKEVFAVGGRCVQVMWTDGSVDWVTPRQARVLVSKT